MIVSFACPSTPEPMGGVAALYEFAGGLARRGHEVHLFHGSFWGRGVRHVDEITWFRFEPSIVHHVVEGDEIDHLPAADVHFGTGAPAWMGLPVLLVQGSDMFSAELEQRAMQTPCLRVCVASWLAEEGRRFGIPPEQFVVVPMGIDHDRFRVTVPIEDRPTRVALPLHDHPAKGARAGLLALERVREARPDVEVVAFHTVEPREPVPDWVRFLHAPSQDQLVAEVYNASQVFVQPSFHEGFGFPAVEAMACGCALVTTDNGGSRDYAIDGETALVVAPHDWGATLVEPILALLGDDERRFRLARAGERHVRRFDWDVGAELLEGHLERYLADPAAFGVDPARR